MCCVIQISLNSNQLSVIRNQAVFIFVVVYSSVIKLLRIQIHLAQSLIWLQLSKILHLITFKILEWNQGLCLEAMETQLLVLLKLFHKYDLLKTLYQELPVPHHLDTILIMLWLYGNKPLMVRNTQIQHQFHFILLCELVLIMGCCSQLFR